MHVLKSYGTQGGVIINTSDCPKDINLKEPVFICFDGLPVPFFIEEWQPKGSGKSYVKFEDIDNLEEAEDLVGKTITVDFTETTENNKDFAGFAVYKVEGEKIGEVTAFCHIPGNPCIQVSYKGKEVLIPFHDDLIRKTDLKKKIIILQIPEGLLE